MSWTKRINHPSEVVAQGQKVKVKVLEINKEKQEISLGMKQVGENPWERVAERFPPGAIVEGKVRNIANYGAFVEIEEGIDGLLHVSDLSWTKKIGHPSEVLKKGESVKAVVLTVDQEKQRIALGLKQMQEDPWTTVIPANYRPGMVIKGHVTKIANFGVFVELEPGLEGLLHISEISDQKIEKPEDQLKVGQELDVKILSSALNGLLKKKPGKMPARNVLKSADCVAVWKVESRRAAWAIWADNRCPIRNFRSEDIAALPFCASVSSGVGNLSAWKTADKEPHGNLWQPSGVYIPPATSTMHRV
jgi:ribosomal protein S1